MNAHVLARAATSFGRPSVVSTRREHPPTLACPQTQTNCVRAKPGVSFSNSRAAPAIGKQEAQRARSSLPRLGSGRPGTNPPRQPDPLTHSYLGRCLPVSRCTRRTLLRSGVNEKKPRPKSGSGPGASAEDLKRGGCFPADSSKFETETGKNGGVGAHAEAVDLGAIAANGLCGFAELDALALDEQV